MQPMIVVFVALMAAGSGTSPAAAGELPWVEVVKRYSADTRVQDHFGAFLAIDGATLVVGAPHPCCLGGKAHILEWVPRFSAWRDTKTLTPIFPGDKQFGTGVTIWGDTVAVGSAAEEGFAVYVYERAAGGEGEWGEVARLLLEEQGPLVLLRPTLLAVGAPSAEVAGEAGAGAVDLFERASAGLWQHRSRLTASDPKAEARFGEALAASGSRLLVGAPQAGDLGDPAGAAYLFARDEAGLWIEAGRLLAADGEGGDRFGAAVAIAGATAIVGAEADDDLGEGSGSAYVYQRDPDGTWSEARKLLASDGAIGDEFGAAVAIAGDIAVAGAPAHNWGCCWDVGAAYVFGRDEGGPEAWEEASKLVASKLRVNGDRFGESVATDGETVVAGVPFDDLADGDAGIIYFFSRTPFRGDICLDYTRRTDGLELAIDGDVITGSWRNRDGEGLNSPLVGFIREGIEPPCPSGPSSTRDRPQNPAKAFAACLPEFGCHGSWNWYFMFDGPDGTLDIGVDNGIGPPGACWSDDREYDLLLGPCPF